MKDQGENLLFEVGDVLLRVNDNKRFIYYEFNPEIGNGSLLLKEEHGKELVVLDKADFKPKYYLDLGRHQ